MQSGITASHELQAAFQSLVSSPAQRGLFVTISGEQLVPGPQLASESGDFASDLHLLTPHLKDNEAAYIILRRFPDAADGFVAVTYVPDAAPVRQKMLLSSTSLTLIRELGIERFREKIFATTKAELTAEGFKKHDQHVKLAAPLTEEEEALGAVKKAEAEEGRGMSVKKAHVSNKLMMSMSDEAVVALKKLAGSGSGHNLVQLKIDVSSETIQLAGIDSVSVSSVSTTISKTEPRYSFFKHTYTSSGGSSLSPIIFIYTCPTASKIKERMVYASSRSWAVKIAETEAGLTVEKKLELSDPEDIGDGGIEAEFNPKVEIKKAFDRPKRPGRK